MTSTAEQLREYAGPALFSHGFRPFFLFGALWAAIAVTIWLPYLTGSLNLPTALDPVAWHAHELLFAYVPAAIAGFLLTAVPNWTGRLPVAGGRLALLFALWASGRIAISTSAVIGLVPSAAIDISFLLALGGIIAREIISAGNTRNLKVLGIVGTFAFANALFHFEAASGLATQPAIRLALAATILLIMLIGGRIIPSFTRNWLIRQKPGNLPAPADRSDIAILFASAVALAIWVALPDLRLTGLLCLVAAAANIYRLGRWAGWRTSGEPLVLVLHVAFAFVPIGFAMVALAIFSPATLPASGALHAWTAGAIGLMTLAVMTRASLGHTGQKLTATPSITFIYVAALAAALARIGAAFDIFRAPMLYLAAGAWVAAFAGFVIVFAPLLTQPRR